MVRKHLEVYKQLKSGKAKSTSDQRLTNLPAFIVTDTSSVRVSAVPLSKSAGSKADEAKHKAIARYPVVGEATVQLLRAPSSSEHKHRDSELPPSELVAHQIQKVTNSWVKKVLRSAQGGIMNDGGEKETRISATKLLMPGDGSSSLVKSTDLLKVSLAVACRLWS